MVFILRLPSVPPPTRLWCLSQKCCAFMGNNKVCLQCSRGGSMETRALSPLYLYPVSVTAPELLSYCVSFLYFLVV